MEGINETGCLCLEKQSIVTGFAQIMNYEFTVGGMISGFVQ